MNVRAETTAPVDFETVLSRPVITFEGTAPRRIRTVGEAVDFVLLKMVGRRASIWQSIHADVVAAIETDSHDLLETAVEAIRKAVERPGGRASPPG